MALKEKKASVVLCCFVLFLKLTHKCKYSHELFSFQGELLNPCRCDGSVRYTHQLCLLKWISERGSWTCELCCYRYHVIAIKMKQPCQVNIFFFS